MNTVILSTIVLCCVTQNMLQKKYNEASDKNYSGNIYAFNIYMSLVALFIFFCISRGVFIFHVPTICYGLIFASGYCITNLFALLAFQNGPMSLTILIISYSLIVPTSYGALFLNENLKVTIIIGIAFLLTSLFLINKSSEKIVISKKWGLYATLAFIGNGTCSTIQKAHQVKYSGAYKSELMISALLLVFIVFLFMFILSREKRKYKALHYKIQYPIFSGICNSIVNFSVMVLSGRLPSIIMFPVISGGGIIITYLIARFLFKEELSNIQKVGFGLGTLSVILMNL